MPVNPVNYISAIHGSWETCQNFFDVGLEYSDQKHIQICRFLVNGWSEKSRLTKISTDYIQCLSLKNKFITRLLLLVSLETILNDLVIYFCSLNSVDSEHREWKIVGTLVAVYVLLLKLFTIPIICHKTFGRILNYWKLLLLLLHDDFILVDLNSIGAGFIFNLC